MIEEGVAEIAQTGDVDRKRASFDGARAHLARNPQVDQVLGDHGAVGRGERGGSQPARPVIVHPDGVADGRIAGQGHVRDRGARVPGIVGVQLAQTDLHSGLSREIGLLDQVVGGVRLESKIRLSSHGRRDHRENGAKKQHHGQGAKTRGPLAVGHHPQRGSHHTRIRHQLRKNTFDLISIP